MLLFWLCTFWLCTILGICNKDEGHEGTRTVQLSNGNQMPVVGLDAYLVSLFSVLS